MFGSLRSDVRNVTGKFPCDVTRSSFTHKGILCVCHVYIIGFDTSIFQCVMIMWMVFSSMSSYGTTINSSVWIKRLYLVSYRQD